MGDDSAYEIHRRSRCARPFVAGQHVTGLVVGLPLTWRQRFAPTQSVRAFARNLAPLGLPVLLCDELWSTAAVERAMVAADVSRGEAGGGLDKLAAAPSFKGAIDALAICWSGISTASWTCFQSTP